MRWLFAQTFRIFSAGSKVGQRFQKVNSQAEENRAPQLPEGLRRRLEQFQRLVWRVKLAEGALAACLGLALSLLLVVGLDRLVDTPPLWRAVLLVAGSAGWGAWLPVVWHDWVWRIRTLENVARLLRRAYPRLGDQLLGIVELERNASGSPALIRAAFEQADEKLARQGLEGAAPRTRSAAWGAALGGLAALGVAGGIVAPEAVGNAALRWLAPWRDTPRYTFAQTKDLPERIVVPYGEDFDLRLELKDQSRWKPAAAVARMEGRVPVTGARGEGTRYELRLPPAKSNVAVQLQVGDERKRVEVVPKTRPELASVRAKVRLPDYLRREEDSEKEVRDGTVALLRGSRVRLELEASRELTEATMDGEAVPVRNGKILTRPVEVSESFERHLTWKDAVGLEAREPLRLRVEAVEDQAPRVTAKISEGDAVVLVNEVVQFDLHAVDDFGVREVGLRWTGDRQSGSKLVAAGDPRQRDLTAVATFCPDREGVKPQSLSLTAYALDYLPNREEAHSRSFVLHILNMEQHLLWLSDEMGKWYRRAEEVYDRERQLHATNRELQKLGDKELRKPENRQRLEAQVEAERANAQRLERLLKNGEELAGQAARNSEFEAGRLNEFAKTIEMLREMAQGRMPEIASLLEEAAKAAAESQAAAGKANDGKPAGDKAGNDKGTAQKEGAAKEGSAKQQAQQEPEKPGKPKPSGDGQDEKRGPDLKVAGEQNWLKKPDEKPAGAAAGGAGSEGISLPSTSLGEAPGEKPQAPGPGMAQKKTDEAVVIQTGMLAELQKVSSALKELLGSLQTSTFVKRLKAASREQLILAKGLEDTLAGGFGVTPAQAADEVKRKSEELARDAVEQSRMLHTVQTDLEAYYHRKQQAPYKRVLDQMREMAVVAEIREGAEQVKAPLNGRSIVMAEFWADTLDRWAEELVAAGDGPGGPGGGQSGEESASLPPEIVLEVMKVLADQMSLREETRELEQGRPALDRPDFEGRASSLAATQRDLRNRTVGAANRIKTIPLGEQNFAQEIGLLVEAGQAMGDALGVLSEPETGERAIGAETEAIELLLRTQRNPGSGGGGGSSARSGMAGMMSRFLERLGATNPNPDPSGRDKRSVDQATGKGGRELPEEFRSGLDEYFNALEKSRER